MTSDLNDHLDWLAHVLSHSADSLSAIARSTQPLSDVALYFRDSVFAGGALGVFFVLTQREKLFRIGKFFDQMMSKYPLTAYRQGGISDSHIQSTREILFFYCLLLMYQIVQYPYSIALRGSSGLWVDFVWWLDLTVQACLVGAILQTYRTVVKDVRAASQGNPEKQESMNEWLNGKLEGMHVRFKDMRLLPLGLLAASFLPATIQFMPHFLQNAATWLRSFASLF